MAEDSKIEWCRHTFNPWRGCTKVSAGCAHCYAETMSGRNPATLGIWGRRGTRAMAADSYWKQPLKWNRAAAAAGERHRVFCASLADVFEGPETMPESAWRDVTEARQRLFRLIEETPSLDWLLLTKRPQNIMKMLPDAWKLLPRPNVWLGTSVENQATADERIPLLLEVPAWIRFLSCEPLLGPVQLRPEWLVPNYAADDGRYAQPGGHGVDWVIVGGESGGQARPMHPDWPVALRDQCTYWGVSYLFKQWGEWSPSIIHATQATPQYDAQGGLTGLSYPLTRVGKVKAGRHLAGRLWDEVPSVSAAVLG